MPPPKFRKLYTGPGYPMDPTREARRFESGLRMFETPPPRGELLRSARRLVQDSPAVMSWLNDLSRLLSNSVVQGNPKPNIIDRAWAAEVARQWAMEDGEWAMEVLATDPGLPGAWRLGLRTSIRHSVRSQRALDAFQAPVRPYWAQARVRVADRVPDALTERILLAAGRQPWHAVQAWT